MDEIEKWISVATKDFSDNQFYMWYSANKAFNTFLNSSLPISKNSYRTQAALLNGLLIYYLDLSDYKILNTKKIAYLILQFDELVEEAKSIQESENMRKLNKLVRCLLYMRIGDFIASIANATGLQASTRAQKQISFAIFAYCLAYECACQSWDNCCAESDPLLAISIAELHLLISNNLGSSVVDRNAFGGFNGNSLHAFVSSFTDNPARRIYNKSFILKDECTISRDLYELDFGRLLEKAWPIHKNIHFLRRLIWILQNFPFLEQTNYSFLDNILHSLPNCPVDPDDACTPESLSILDIKIFLFRLSRNLESTKENQMFLLPWLFYQKPNLSQQQFWEAFNIFLENQEDSKRIDLAILMNITISLEQIRDPNLTASEAENLLEMEIFLKRLNSSNKDKTHAFCENLLWRYSNAINAVTLESDWVLVVEELVVDADGDGQIQSDAESKLDEKLEHDLEKKQFWKENIQEINAPRENNTSSSTQTDILLNEFDNEIDKSQLRIANNLAEMNFRIGMWIKHNEALKNLFITKSTTEH